MGSLRVNLKKLRFQGKITNEEYESLIKKLDGHDEQIRICERAKVLEKVLKILANEKWDYTLVNKIEQLKE